MWLKARGDSLSNRRHFLQTFTIWVQKGKTNTVLSPSTTVGLLMLDKGIRACDNLVQRYTVMLKLSGGFIERSRWRWLGPIMLLDQALDL